MTLEQLVEMLRGERPVKIPTQVELQVTEESPPPPQLLERLSRLQRLGLLNGDVLLSLVSHAPIDPIGLVAHLLQQGPAGWTFSAIDCTIVRVLARRSDNAVAALVCVSLIDNTAETLVLNRENQLVPFRRFDAMTACETRQPGLWVLEEVQHLCDDAVLAVAREQSRPTMIPED